MFSPVKITLFAFLSFATLALAIPASEGRSKDLKALISSTNTALEETVLPLTYITHANATSDCIEPVVEEVIVLVQGLVSSLQGSSLSGCSCTASEIYKLIAGTLKIILGPLGTVSGSYSDLGALLGRLVSVLVTLLEVVLAVVGGLAWELIILLIGNGCAGLMFGLRLDGLISALGLGGLGGLLGHGR